VPEGQTRFRGSPSYTRGMPDAVLEQPAAAVSTNLEAARKRIDRAAREAGRDPADVRLLPVSKTFGNDSIRAAYAAGVRLLGENLVQEAQRKHEALADELPELSWAIIGHLQTNKARYVARFATEFHALDSTRLASMLQRRLDIEDRTLDVYVQVNAAGEESRYGLAPAETVDFIRTLGDYDRLQLRGLMTMAPFTDDEEVLGSCFRTVRELRDATLEVDGRATGLSMGMSADLEVAIREGATTVRVGSAIFGSR